MTPSGPHPARSAGTTRVRETIEQLRTRILGGEWPVGARIPTEPRLVEALGVGRNTLREAVRALVHAGVLEVRQGSGTYVVSTDELAGVVSRQVGGARLTEVVEVRRALEVEAARLAARRRTAEDLAALDAALADREAAWASGRVAEFAAADAALHAVIVAAAHNTMLADLYTSMSTAIRHSLAEALGPDLTPDRHVDHTRLVDAIRAGDAARAAREASAFLEPPHGA
ncbi:FadR/GntR family transcriptional regulator [Micromonosporaceae bacterium DT55]|uniref:FadR/GntR family transcriptional regulator n=1 Tax=Melissospora conviva TaxID=3388432 RepID=UPI003C25FD11